MYTLALFDISQFFQKCAFAFHPDWLLNLGTSNHPPIVANLVIILIQTTSLTSPRKEISFSSVIVREGKEDKKAPVDNR